jgi:predicted MFS family arabinose efflux permease
MAPGLPRPLPVTRRLAVRLYLYTTLGDLIPLYGLYAVLFDDAGLTTAEISSLFVIWSLTAIVVEVPSGVWADTYSRRTLLVLAPLLAAAGFTLWVVAPSYWAFALGFVLWGSQGALRSGALEALVYEELARHGQADSYARVLGRATAAGTASAVTGVALATPVLALGGYAGVGAVSVLACLLCAAVAAGFPENRDRRHGADRTDGTDGTRTAAPDVSDSEDRDPSEIASGPDLVAGWSAYLSTLREGITQVRGRTGVRLAVLAVPAVGAVWESLEEYVPLLARESGVTSEGVPLVVLIVSTGLVAGGLLGGTVGSRGHRAPAVVLAGAAGTLAGAAALTAGDRRLVGFVGIALAFTAFQAVTVAVGARLQDAVTGDARSTVTSLAGLATDLAAIGVFALYAAGSAVASHRGLFVALALVYLPVAVLLAVSRRNPAVVERSA